MRHVNNEYAIFSLELKANAYIIIRSYVKLNVEILELIIN